jgi:MoaA/NifB/PqqE/SkfB family radical SAM enzyme
MAKKKINKGENPLYVDTKDKLDKIGPGMCLAKWTQVTIHLQNGHNHSCHHPTTHKISDKEIIRNPSALHNTRYKKEKRREMLEGKRPEECDYCWSVEDNSDSFSDRVFKSSEKWSLPHYDAIANSDWRDDINPKYVEVAFSNACNFKCSYCAPQFSSQWTAEIEKFGGYKTSTKFNDPEQMLRENTKPFLHTDSNPYVDAFWKWWPDLYRDLYTFRITGGEPLLSKDTWGVLDYIIEQKEPNRELNLAINSNLGVPDKLIDEFIEKISRITEENRVKEFVIFTSCDAWGEQAEYIRNGLVFNRFWDNVNKILSKCPRVTLTFMVTYNALSVFSFNKLIKGVYDLKNEYGSKQRYWDSAVFLDTSYLRYPFHQAVQVLPYQFSNNVLEQAINAEFLGTLEFTNNYIGYTDIEIQKLKRIYDWMISPQDANKQMANRKDFHTFFTEHDRRRGTDFLKTFPELEEFYNFCGTIK